MLSPPPLPPKGDQMSKTNECDMRRKRIERLNVGGVSVRSRNGSPSRTGCVVNGEMTKAGNK